MIYNQEGIDIGDTAMTVASILRQKGPDVATISPDADIKAAADWLHAKNIGALLVMSGDAIIGVISERDIVHAFSGMARLWRPCRSRISCRKP